MDPAKEGSGTLEERLFVSIFPLLLLIRLFAEPNKAYITEFTQSLQHPYYIHTSQEGERPVSSTNYESAAYLQVQSIHVSYQMWFEDEYD